MSLRASRVLIALWLVLGLGAASFAQTIEYTLSFPAPHERWMQVEARFPATPNVPLELRMSRSSPGRYATHEFAKNLFLLTAATPDGTALPIDTVRPDVWSVTAPGDTVVVSYRLFGDHVDGTYFAVDATHAHINAPAVYLWSPSQTGNDVRVRLVAPKDESSWRAMTQLFPTDDARVFTAPNLQYLLDSPIEFSDADVRTFTVPSTGDGPPATIRVAMHHLGTDAALDAFTADIERIVLEQRAIFGELPAFDTGTYTFLMDYLPWARGDGMEHRNSTVCTASVGIEAARGGLLGTASHEFFHAWNVERIRPASLEPFDFSQANMSGELWLAEGFTSYYGELVMRRAGLVDDAEVLGTFGSMAGQALTSPGVEMRSAVEMSRLAPFVDAAAYVDRTYWENTYLSYYTYGAAIGLGLDLTLRQRSNGETTLDDYMRALWQTFGKVPGPEPGYVGRPYTLADLRDTLAEVSGDKAFAADFFARHITGRDAIDFAALFRGMGLSMQANAKAPWIGAVRLDPRSGTATVANATVAGTPVHEAGLNRDDEVVSLGGRPIRNQADWDAAVSGATVGDTLDLLYRSRGRDRRATVKVVADPRFQLVPADDATDAQRAMREAWLASRRG